MSGDVARSGRLVRPERVEPLYPAARLLAANVVDAGSVLAEARKEAAAARDEAREVLDRAQAEAERTVTEARAEAERIRVEAAAQAREEVRDRVLEQLARMDQAQQELRAEVVAEVERSAFHFARAVLDVELAVRPGRIVDLVAGVLDRADRFRELRLHLHPGEAPLVREVLDELRERTPGADLAVVADPDVPLHDVRLETEMGAFHGGVDDQLRPLAEHLGIPVEEELP